MNNVLDTSGYSCPEPVIMTKKALKDKPSSFTVIVDNVASRENVTRYAEAIGYTVNCEASGAKWNLVLKK